MQRESCPERQCCSSDAGSPLPSHSPCPLCPTFLREQTLVLGVTAACRVSIGSLLAPQADVCARVLPPDPCPLDPSLQPGWVGITRTPGAVLSGSPPRASLHPCLLCHEVSVGTLNPSTLVFPSPILSLGVHKCAVVPAAPARHVGLLPAAALPSTQRSRVTSYHDLPNMGKGVTSHLICFYCFCKRLHQALNNASSVQMSLDH